MRILIAVLSFALVVGADDKKGHKHTHAKTQKAHDHGAAEINLAVEGNKVDIEFRAPAQAIVGFEYVPTTAADKKKQADALAALKANIAKMVIFDPKLGCKIAARSVEVQNPEPDHAEIDGDFEAICAQSPAGSKVAFGVTKTYPGLTTVKVQAVGASGSAGAEIKSDKGTVTLPQ
jgi:hypothetical protein